MFHVKHLIDYFALFLIEHKYIYFFTIGVHIAFRRKCFAGCGMNIHKSAKVPSRTRFYGGLPDPIGAGSSRTLFYADQELRTQTRIFDNRAPFLTNPLQAVGTFLHET